ncbi:MAG: glycoside hydrolase family 127 protein, partial [Lentisphaeria bacterium]|nr:glycoside hydrolase family 127 protein [Lentisphaeria bacterium]
WGKAYEYLSCVEGLVELHRLTGESSYLIAAERFHASLMAHERNPVGIISFHDKFCGSARLRNGMSEICESIHWSRLSYELFLATGDTRYADEFEQTLYNAVLVAPNQEGTWALRRLRLSHEHASAPKHCKLEHHHCCVDNLPRGFMQAADIAVLREGAGVNVVLYNDGQGEVTLASGRTLEIEIEGGYPRNGALRISLRLAEAETFPLRLRIPQWSTCTTVVAPDGATSQAFPGGWFEMSRKWRDGDVVEIRLDMSARVEFFDARGLGDDDPLVQTAVQQWANLPVFMPEPTIRLSVEEAQPQRPAILVQRGPLVLARDLRLGDEDVCATLPQDAAGAPVPRLEERPAPDGVWLAWDAWFGDNTPPVPLCDFSSAGSTWDKNTSLFNTWLPLP